MRAARLLGSDSTVACRSRAPARMGFARPSALSLVCNEFDRTFLRKLMLLPASRLSRKADRVTSWHARACSQRVWTGGIRFATERQKCVRIEQVEIKVGRAERRLWRGGRSGATAQELAQVGRTLDITDVAAAIAADTVKSALRANTNVAISAGIFGVPTVCVGGELSWGNDASPMVAEFLDDPQRFRSGEYRRIAQLPTAIARTR